MRAVHFISFSKGEEGGVERREGEQMRADREGFRHTNSN